MLPEAHRETSLLLLVLLLSSQLSGSLAIVQGDIDSGNQYGQVCALLRQTTDGYFATCSGVLVTASAVLTAAHCLGLFDVVTCDNAIEGAPTTYNVSAQEGHPSYSDAALTPDQKQDLAVVKLKTAPPADTPQAALPPQYVLDDIKEAGGFGADEPFVVVGYGGTLPSVDPQAPPEGPPNKDRRYTKADYVRLTVTRLVINVSLARGVGGSICRGDSGGGVFYAKTGLLAGITVEADNQCTKTGRVNRIDTPEVRRWLGVQGIALP